MKNLFNVTMLVLFTGLYMGSCTIEKRLYNNGYHVEWKRNYKGSSESSNDAVQQPNFVSFQETTESNVAVDALGYTDVNEDIAPSNSIQSSSAEVIDVNEVTFSDKEINRSKSSEIVQELETQEQIKAGKFGKLVIKSTSKSDAKSAGGPDKALLIVLCFLLPWLAVGLATNWDVKAVVFNLLWSLTCIGGIIHALVVVSREA